MNLLDTIGPVMIGPSSSHTAGAARIGRVARLLLDEELKSAVIDLHGSFAKTWAGHGTDRAVVGGLMGMQVDDENLRNSRSLAKQAGLDIQFRTVELADAHPNTMILHLTGVKGGKIDVQAASVGGGEILVQYINGLEVGFGGKKTTLVIFHQDLPGVIYEVSRVLSEKKLNIATMRVFREEVGGRAMMALEMDDMPDQNTLEEMRKIPAVRRATLLSRV